MPTYYEIEARNVDDFEEIRRLGRMGFEIVTTAVRPVPYGKLGQAVTMVILQRPRAVPERGPIHDEYYNGEPNASEGS